MPSTPKPPEEHLANATARVSAQLVERDGLSTQGAITATRPADAPTAHGGIGAPIDAWAAAQVEPAPPRRLRVTPHLGLELGTFAMARPSIAPAGVLDLALSIERFRVGLAVGVAWPESQTISVNPVRSGTVTAFSFQGALAVGACFGGRFAVCPSGTVGLRTLALSAEGRFYRPTSTVLVVPSLGLDVVVQYRLFSGLWLSASVRPFVPLGTVGGSVEGTSATITSAWLEGWGGVGLRWAPGAPFE